MKKITILVLTFCIIAGSISAKDNLAILTFSGGQAEEGETIAELFSFDAMINNYFSPIPRTSITRAINQEQRFQISSGMTDADTIVSIGQQLGARYVVAGNITSIGRSKLLVISIMDIRNLQQIAGDYQTYNRIEEIRGKLPDMAANIIRATQINTSELPKLAIVPVQLQGGVEQRDADTLAQLLAVHIIRSGKYSVYPRTKSLEQVMEEHKTQMRGGTSDRNVVGVGFGANPDLVLSVVARKLGTNNMFNAVIINVKTGTQVTGRSADYRDINDGMRAMVALSNALTSTEGKVKQPVNNKSTIRTEGELIHNWISLEALGFGLGTKYEYKFNPYFSVGGNFYFNFMSILFHMWSEFAIDAAARYYPWGNSFYIGLGLGFHGFETGYYDEFDDRDEFVYFYENGFAVTPGIGFKIDLGKSGGFFLDTGLRVPIIFASEGPNFNIIPYLSLGWAF